MTEGKELVKKQGSENKITARTLGLVYLEENKLEEAEAAFICGT